MPQVNVSFKYEPDEPDPEDGTGMSADEFERLTEQLMALGADDIEIEA